MAILDKILHEVDLEISHDRAKHSLKSLRRRLGSLPPAKDFAAALSTGRFGLIAEVKGKSPSMDQMKPLDPKRLANAPYDYDKHDVVKAISILTQWSHFGGKRELIPEYSKKCRKPILRKDFIKSEYQVIQSRVLGADAILLMANVVTDKSKFEDLHDLARSLGLSVLCEVHDEHELDILPKSARIIGINSRKFKSSKGFKKSIFKPIKTKDSSIDIDRFGLFKSLPADSIKVAESGINIFNLAQILEKYSFDAGLVGTSILKSNKPITDELNLFEGVIDECVRNLAPEDSEACISSGSNESDIQYGWHNKTSHLSM